MTAALGSARTRRLLELAVLGGIVLIAVVLRFWDIDRFGVRGDEAIYSGQAATIAGQPDRMEYFAVFRAHPLLYQTALGLLYMAGLPDEAARWLVAATSAAGVVLVWALGRRVAGPVGGLSAAGIYAVVLYSVVNSRMALLDMPAGLLLTLAVYALVRYLDARRMPWLVFGAVTLALACLTKEVIGATLVGLLATQVYRPLRIGWRPIVVFGAVFVAVGSIYPISLVLGHGVRSALAYLSWQLGGRGTAGFWTYFQWVEPYVGLLGAAMFAIGLLAIIIRRERAAVLVGWMTFFFLTVIQLWKLREFQLPAMAFPLAAVVMGYGVVAVGWAVAGVVRRLDRRSLIKATAVATATSIVLAIVMTVPMTQRTWAYLTDVPDISLTPGRGGYPGQLEAARWFAANVPEGAVCIVPTANLGALMQFYADRSCFGINVPPPPRRHNPADVQVEDPSEWISQSRVTYIITDVVSAGSQTVLVDRLMALIAKHHGRIVHEERGTVRNGDSAPYDSWLVRVYEVRP